MYHVPDFIRKYSNIKQFSCQGKLDSYLHMDYMFIGYMFAFLAVEKKNGICKATYFKSSNKWNATNDNLIHEQKLDYLKNNARRKRKCR